MQYLLSNTVITIGVMLLKEVIVDNDDAFDDELASLLHAARSSLEGAENSPEFISVWTSFCSHVDEMKLGEKIEMTIEKRKDNKTLQFLFGFVRLVKRLFTFIEAVRSLNWSLYLSSFEFMIKDFASLDRIK